MGVRGRGYLSSKPSAPSAGATEGWWTTPSFRGAVPLRGLMCFGVFVQLNEGTRYAKSKPIGYVIQENGCWEWVGFKFRGYGRWEICNGKTGWAHRRLYEMYKGPIPEGLSIDHLCRNHGCVNPDHLEPVTHKENVLRGESSGALAHRTNVCKRGHTDWKSGESGGTTRRWCRTCLKESQRRHYLERVAKEGAFWRKDKKTK